MLALGIEEKAQVQGILRRKNSTGLSDQSEYEAKKRGKGIAHVSAKLLLAAPTIYWILSTHALSHLIFP